MLLAWWLVLSNRSHQVMTPLLFSGLFLGWRPKCYLFIIHHKPFRLISSWLGPSTSWSSISASVEIMEKLKSFDLVVYILGKKWKKLRFISSLCLWMWPCHWTSILINSVRIWINISKFCHKYINLYQNQNHMIVHFIGNFIQSNIGLIHPFNTVLYSVLIDIKYSVIYKLPLNMKMFGHGWFEMNNWC